MSLHCDEHNHPFEFFGYMGVDQTTGAAIEDWRCPACEIRELRDRVNKSDRMLCSIALALPCGFYPDESLPSRVRIMRQHWDKTGEVMEENGNLKRRLAQLSS